MYKDARPKKMCYDNEDIEDLNNCASDDECLEIGSQICDEDPKCFGVAWNDAGNGPLRICRSTSLVDDNDGGRTILKCMYWKTCLRIWDIAYERFSNIT